MSKRALPTQVSRERALLVGTDRRSEESLLSLEDSLMELQLLAETAGLAVVGEVTQHIGRPDPKTYVGAGKVKEIKDRSEDLLADVVLFDEELNPRHQRELELALGEDVRVLDRTALILDVFAQHARSREGSLQVELAQYEYRLPRLTRAWTHLARQAGGGAGRTGSAGGVGLRGPGETQLEVDRRDINRRIDHLKEELEKVRAHRGRYRSRRRGSHIPTVALVGYTNAGKSTLLNRLAGSDVYVANRLFATLDPTTRKVELPGGRAILLTDTVGFIQKLPTMLVAAFQATLEEISEADLLLHVVDVTHPNAEAQIRAVQDTLVEIGADTIPVLIALNKIDAAPAPEAALELDSPSVRTSGLTGEGLSELMDAIQHELYEVMEPLEVELPYREGKLVSLFHEHGVVEHVEHDMRVMRMAGRIPRRLLWAFEPYLGEGQQEREAKDAALG